MSKKKNLFGLKHKRDIRQELKLRRELELEILARDKKDKLVFDLWQELAETDFPNYTEYKKMFSGYCDLSKRSDVKNLIQFYNTLLPNSVNRRK